MFVLHKLQIGLCLCVTMLLHVAVTIIETTSSPKANREGRGGGEGGGDHGSPVLRKPECEVRIGCWGAPPQHQVPDAQMWLP